MGDLISRERVIATIDSFNVFESRYDQIKLELMIRELPSAQPEIIRCRECKWKQGAECVRFADVRPFADDFCSRAERRTDG